MAVLRAIGFVVALLVLAFCISNPPKRNTHRERPSYRVAIPKGRASNPPMRCELGMGQLADLLALKLAGRDVPERYAGLSPRGLLSDLMLVAQGEVSRQRQRAEYAESTGAASLAAATRLWRLVFDAGKRKTMRTADVRAALEGGA